MSDVILGPGGEPSDDEPLPTRTPMDLTQWFIVALFTATSTRIIGSVVDGIIEWSRASDRLSRFGGFGRQRAGFIILDFVRFGDGVGALLILAVAGLLFWYVRTHAQWLAGRRLALMGVALAALTALASLATIIGYALYLNGQETFAGSMTAVVGESVAYALMSAASAVAMYRLTWQIDEQFLAADADPDES